MKKIVSIFLTLALALVMLGGCVGDTPQKSGAQNKLPTVIDPGEFLNTDIYPLEGNHSLSMGIALQNAEDSYLLKLMSDAVGVDISYRYLTNEQAPLLFVDMDNMPDILFSAGNTFGLTLSRINSYGNAGALINYMDYLDQMPNLAKAYIEHPDLFDGVMSAEGAVYTLPYYVYTLTGCSNFLFFRADHLKEVGWDSQPATVDELTQLLRALKEYYGATDTQYIPMVMYESSDASYNGDLSSYLFPAFGELVDPGIHIDSDGNAVAGFASEQFKRMVSYIRELVHEGLLDEDMFTAKSSLMQAFMNENHASVSSRMLDLNKSAYADGVENYYISQPLTSEYTDTPVFAKPTVARKWGAMISTTCEDLDAALAYMDAFFATDDNPLNEEGTIYNLSFWLGEEGVDWYWVEEGVSYQKYEKPDGWEAQNGFSGTPYIGKFHAIRIDGDGTVSLLAQGVKDNCVPYETSVIRADSLALTEDENDIYLETWTDISSYVIQMYAAFITGNADIDTQWDAYISNLYKMRLQELLDCFDTAYARYTARQMTE